MPTHLVFESVARRLDAGTYSPAVAARRLPPAVKPSAPSRYLAEVLASGALGAVLGFLLGG